MPLTSPRRRWLSNALAAIAVVAALLAIGLGYVQRAGGNSDQFADRAATAVQDRAVRGLLATRVTDQLVLQNKADLIAARPLITATVSRVLGGTAFSDVFRRAVADVHRSVFDRSSQTVSLRLVNAGTLAAAVLELRRPELAADLSRARPVVVTRRHIGPVLARVADVSERLKVLEWALVVAAMASVAASLTLSADRRRTAALLGLGLVGAGVVIVLGMTVGRAVARGSVSGAHERDAVAAVWDAFLGDLRNAGWVLAGCGAIIAAASSTARLVVREPHPPSARDATARLGLLRDRGVLVGGAAGVLILVTVGAFAAAGGTSASATGQTVTTCNGFVSLCEKRFDHVTLAATHNSMSAPLPGWFSAEQDRPILDQMRDGIRGLLVDTHYGDDLPNGRVRTVLDGKPDASRDGLSKAEIDSALRIRARLGFKGKGRRAIYLCHSFCELGATRLATVLRQIKEFLVSHPGEVMVLINQDEIPPAAFVGALRDAGLATLVYRGSVSRWPTLREMIDSGQRLVVFAEHDAGAASWYRLGYDQALQETPYAFSKTAQLTSAGNRAATCSPNRGPSTAPLLLVNHWITTDPVPLASRAAAVNAEAPLLARARACERIRHRVANLIAVNFYRRGDLLGVVDTLNGTSPKQ